jgi:hypothetical protein
LYPEYLIIRNLEEVIVANEKFIKADNIEFPLMSLRKATTKGLDLMGTGSVLTQDIERYIKNNMCCLVITISICWSEL